MVSIFTDWLHRMSCLDETAMPSVYFCPLLNLAASSTFKSAECGSHSARLVASVVLLCINNSTSVATSNKLHGAETRLTVPNVGVDFLRLSPPKACFWTPMELIAGHKLSLGDKELQLYLNSSLGMMLL